MGSLGDFGFGVWGLGFRAWGLFWHSGACRLVQVIASGTEHLGEKLCDEASGSVLSSTGSFTGIYVLKVSLRVTIRFL